MRTASQGAAIPGVAAMLPALLFLAISGISASPYALVAGLSCLTFLFASILIQQLTSLPYLNPLALISAGTGLFYCGGSALNQFVRTLMSDNPFTQFARTWSNYDVIPTTAAALLVFLCCYAGVLASRSISSLTLNVDVKPEARVVSVVLGLVTLLLGYLILTQKLTVASSGRALKVAEASEWLTLAGAAAPAASLPLTYLIFSKDAVRYRIWGLVCALPILSANFLMGRRYVIAMGLGVIVGLIVYRKIRISWWQWAGAIAGAVVVVAVLTVPFNQLRSLSDTGRDFSFQEAVGVMLSGEKVAGARYMDSGDTVAISAARADIMRELSQVMTQMPATSFRYGSGIFSQLAMVVPGQMWADKQFYIDRKMYSEYTILTDSGLPFTDIAGSLVLYSYGELGWLAPIYFCVVLIGFVAGACSLGRRLAPDSGFFLWTLSLLLSYAVLADNSSGARMFVDLRFLLILGALHIALCFILPRSYVAVSRRAAVSRPGS